MSNKLCECAVPFCSDHELAASIGVPFHRFPTDDAIRQQWHVAIHSDQLPVTLSLDQLSRKKVCGKHFKPSDYQVDIKHQVAPHIYPQKHLLKTTAVPSIFTSRETSKTPRNIWTQSVINNSIVKKKKNLSTNIKSGIIHSKKSPPSSINHQKATCPQPMFMFHNISSLNNEITTYYQCDLCDELFLKPTDLQIHHKIHNIKIEVDMEDMEFFRNKSCSTSINYDHPKTHEIRNIKTEINGDEDLSGIQNSDCQSEKWHTDLVKYNYLETNNNKTDSDIELSGIQNTECQSGTDLTDDCNYSKHVQIKQDLYAEPCSVPDNNRKVKTEIDKDITYHHEPTLNTAVHVKSEIDKYCTMNINHADNNRKVKTEIDKDITYDHEPTLNTAVHVKSEIDNHQFDINSSEEDVPLTFTGMDYSDTDTGSEMGEADVQETPLDVQGGVPNTNVQFRTSDFLRNESDHSNTCDKIENIASNSKSEIKQKIDDNDVLEKAVPLQAGKRFEVGTSFEAGKCFDIDDNLKKHVKILYDEHQPCKCDICDKIFLNTRTLASHRKIHFGKKSHRCHMCRKCFSPADQLGHARLHAEKPYKCNVCDQLFTHSIYLKHHTKIHDF